MHRLGIKLLSFSSFSNSSLYGQSFVLTKLHLTHFKDCLFSLTSSGNLFSCCYFLHFCTVSLKISVGLKILSSECLNQEVRFQNSASSGCCFLQKVGVSKRKGSQKPYLGRKMGNEEGTQVASKEIRRTSKRTLSKRKKPCLKSL